MNGIFLCLIIYIKCTTFFFKIINESFEIFPNLSNQYITFTFSTTQPNAKMADPICTFVFSIIVIFTTVKIMKESILVLLDGVPTNVAVRKLEKELSCIQGVRYVHITFKNHHFSHFTFFKMNNNCNFCFIISQIYSSLERMESNN